MFKSYQIIVYVATNSILNYKINFYIIAYTHTEIRNTYTYIRPGQKKVISVRSSS